MNTCLKITTTFIFLLFIISFNPLYARNPIKVNGLSTYFTDNIYCNFTGGNDNDCYLSGDYNISGDIYLDPEQEPENLNLILTGNTTFMLRDDTISNIIIRDFNSLVVDNGAHVYFLKNLGNPIQSKFLISTDYLIIKSNSALNINLSTASYIDNIISHLSDNPSSTEIVNMGPANIELNSNIINDGNLEINDNGSMNFNYNSDINFEKQDGACSSNIVYNIYKNSDYEGVSNVEIYSFETTTENNSEYCEYVSHITKYIHIDFSGGLVKFNNVLNKHTANIYVNFNLYNVNYLDANPGVDNFTESYSTSIIFKNIDIKLPNVLNNNGQNIAYISTCDQDIYLPDGATYNLCRLHYFGPSVNLDTAIDSEKLIIKNRTNCDINFITPDTSSDFILIKEDKAIYPFFFGFIKDSNQSINPDFSNHILIDYDENVNTNLVVHYFDDSNFFIFDPGYQDNPYIFNAKFLNAYYIFSTLTYSDLDINLNYPFRLYK